MEREWWCSPSTAWTIILSPDDTSVQHYTSTPPETTSPSRSHAWIVSLRIRDDIQRLLALGTLFHWPLTDMQGAHQTAQHGPSGQLHGDHRVSCKPWFRGVGIAEMFSGSECTHDISTPARSHRWRHQGLVMWWLHRNGLAGRRSFIPSELQRSWPHTRGCSSCAQVHSSHAVASARLGVVAGGNDSSASRQAVNPFIPRVVSAL